MAGERPPLRVKFGIDPTSTDIHIGHSVVLRKLADFQRFGHVAVRTPAGRALGLAAPLQQWPAVNPRERSPLAPACRRAKGHPAGRTSV